MFNDTPFKFSLESIEILKKAMRLKPLETIIPYFLEILSTDDFNKLILIFKEELNNIAKNYSKFELKKMLSEHFMRKYNQDSLSIINVIFKEKLDEKYFFESQRTYIYNLVINLEVDLHGFELWEALEEIVYKLEECKTINRIISIF